MGFILIPLLLILASVGGVLFITLRKLPRLRELAEAESPSGAYAESGWRAFVYELCPEIWNWAKDIRIKEYKDMWLIEAEKLLRRLRLTSLKIDRFSGLLIKKIRNRASSENGSTFSATETKKDKEETEAKADDKTELKKNEQRLIMEIAKNPKNASLYEELGDLYDKMSDYLDSKESYEAGIELNSNNEKLKGKLSQVLEKLNKPDISQK